MLKLQNVLKGINLTNDTVKSGCRVSGYYKTLNKLKPRKTQSSTSEGSHRFVRVDRQVYMSLSLTSERKLLQETNARTRTR